MSVLHQIALTYVKNVGPAIAKSMVSYFGGVERIFTVSQAKLLEIPGITANRLVQLGLSEAMQKAEQELKFIEKNNIDVLFYTDPRYPKRLKNCNDSPILLYSKGKVELNNRRVISIVGTRNATEYGRHLCRQLV